jgi:hypothetical protein
MISVLRKASYLLALSLILASCRTNPVYISVLVPAPVSISPEAKRAGIINRSILPKDAKTGVHVVLTAGTIAMLKEGSEECVRGLKDALLENNRFDQVNMLHGVKMTNQGPGIFPSPVSWDEVQAVCRANKVDVLLILELFDTELKVVPNAAPDLSTPGKAVNSVLTTEVTFSTTVKAGWRIYDPATKTIADESVSTQVFSFTGSAVSGAATADALIGRKETVKKTANDIGRRYAKKVVPYWLRVTREYYVRGNDNFKKAMRMARANNWDKAGEVWQRETTNSKDKIAGRATYNMAILNEINGQLDEAIRWAQKSYEEYNNKLALRYLRILRERKAGE